jgi:hypothetical protein
VATPIIIFPSLSRAPSLDTSTNTQDDTIRDSFDAGYVATRPRFTRGRRAWNMNVRNLQLEDVRALQNFAMNTAQRGGNSFYYPNILPNGSFEFPAAAGSSQFLAGWNLVSSASPAIFAATNSNAFDGATALLIESNAGQTLANLATAEQLLESAAHWLSPSIGDVYTFVAQVATRVTAGMTALGVVQAVVTYSDASTQTVTETFTLPASGAGYAPCTASFMVPTSGSATAVSMQVSFGAQVENTSGSTLTFSGTVYFELFFDVVGLAQTTSGRPQGSMLAMVGSNPLPFPVRFTASKLPAFSDLGWGPGYKVYGSTFSLDEV